MKKILIVLSVVLFVVCGCNKSKVNSINKEKVIDLMKEGALLIDVRTFSEYNQGHIEEAINIDVQDILKETNNLSYNNSNISKDKKIIVYCRSGSRSRSAAEKLVDMGYNYVYDFGSIDNWN